MVIVHSYVSLLEGTNHRFCWSIHHFWHQNQFFTETWWFSIAFLAVLPGQCLAPTAPPKRTASFCLFDSRRYPWPPLASPLLALQVTSKGANGTARNALKWWNTVSKGTTFPITYYNLNMVLKEFPVWSPDAFFLFGMNLNFMTFWWLFGMNFKTKIFQKCHLWLPKVVVTKSQLFYPAI